MEILKLKKIVWIPIVFFALCGCGMKEEKQAGEKLFWAIEENNVQGVKESLKNRAVNLEKLPKKDDSSFQLADRRALALALTNIPVDEEIILALINAGADVNSKAEDGSTYLMGDFRGADEILLEAGIDVNEKNKSGETAIDLYLSNPQDEYVHSSGKDISEQIALFETYGGKLSSASLQAYLEADGYAFGKELIEKLQKDGKKTGISKDLEYAICGNSQGLLEYLNKEKISDKESVLLQAAAHCNVEVLKELKKQGCDFSIKDKGDKNLIHIASKYNHVEVVSYLLKEGINPDDVTDIYGNNALTIAAIEADQEKVQVLMDYGMDWQIGDAFGRDTWIAVCKGGTAESIVLMLERNFYPTDEEIIYGYENCNHLTFQALLEAKIPYDREYVEEGYVLTGFFELCCYHPELAESICDMDAEVKITPEILETVISNGNSELALKMIERVESLDVCFTVSPLEAAVLRGEKELVEHIVEKGADVNYVISGEEEEYHTVMHTAASLSSTEILGYLIEHGGNIAITNYEGKTPYEIAKESKCYDNMKLLEGKL